MKETGKALTLFFLTWLTFYAITHSWVFILDETNLVIHEAGHVLFMPFGELIATLGGSLLQILIPVGVAIAFVRRADIYSALLSLWWAGESMLGVGRYIADARAQELPLIGGDHDWALILSRWPSSMQYDTVIGGTVRGIGIALMCLTLVFCVYLLSRSMKTPPQEAGV